jgi:hypothetical protein
MAGRDLVVIGGSAGALEHVDVDHVLPAGSIGPLLARLADEPILRPESTRRCGAASFRALRIPLPRHPAHRKLRCPSYPRRRGRQSDQTVL